MQLPPKDRNTSREASQVNGDDDDDNPFRPSKDLQSEDQRAQESRRANENEQGKPTDDSLQNTRTSNDPDSRTNHASSTLGIRPQHSQNPHSESPNQVEKQEKPAFSKRKREPRKELRRFERIKPRPKLDPEHAASESVYFRRPGNESVVGSGTYGKVFKAIHVFTKDKVALKKIRMEGERDGVCGTLSLSL